jgi:hypothetical protein
LPLRWSAIIVDCVQNLRSALDHLVNELAVHRAGRTNNGVPSLSGRCQSACGRKIGLLPARHSE